MTTVEIFPWNDRFNTGIPDIDAQHHQLVDLLNTLVTRIAFDGDATFINTTLDELKRYADFHFRSEEAVWGEIFSGDSWETRHMESHQRFSAEILAIETEHASSPPEDVAKKLVRFLTHWLALHIIEHDNRMAKVVHAVRTGYSLEQAKSLASEQMGGTTQAMIETIMFMYDCLADRTLQLSSEINRRSVAERHLIEANSELQAKARIIGDRNAQLDAMFNLSPDGFVAFSRDGKIKFVNPAFQSMTGIPLEEIVGGSEDTLDSSLKMRCDSPHLFKGIKSILSCVGKEPSLGKITLSDPHRVVLQVVGIFSDSKGISKILYFRDVTHESAVDQMKSEFLTTAAHELRNPMASIYGFSEVLMTQELDPSTREEIVRIIFSQSELMVSILNELLDLARIESRRGKDFNLRTHSVQSLVDGAINGFHVPPGRNSPTAACPNEPIYVRADREKILQAITNVISNAYKYSPGGGEVSITVEAPSVGTSENGLMQPTVSISVADQGVGMSPDQVARVGERFYRVERTGIPGTGLGMSIVKEIVALHHGRIAIQSEPDVGTTVTLVIPLAREDIDDPMDDDPPDYTVQFYENPL